MANVVGYKERTTLYLKDLDPDSLENIRQKISQETDQLIDKKAHPMAGGLMSMLCDPAVISVLSADHIIRMIEAIFPPSVLEKSWLIKYSDMLLNVVDIAKKSNPQTRADKYEQFLRGVLVHKIRERAHTSKVQGELNLLLDSYKAAACLYRYYLLRENEFSFKADRACMDNLNKALRKITNIGNQILGIPLAPVKEEERQYATFLSWVLEEMILKQEEPKAGDESWWI